MYSSSRAKQIVKKDVAFLTAGIHDDVRLTGVRYETSIQGNNFIEFKFEKDGKIMTHTEWEPSKTTQKGNLSQEEFDSKIDNQYKRIEQILLCFYKEEELQFEDGDFKTFAKWVTEMLNKDTVKQSLIRIKAVYNDKGYTTLPKYARYTFIESMDKVKEGTSVITKLGIDRFDKPVIADNEVSNANPFQVVNGTLDNTQNNSASKTDDLPF